MEESIPRNVGKSDNTAQATPLCQIVLHLSELSGRFRFSWVDMT